MGTIKDLSCVECKKTYPPRKGLYTCPACGPAGILDVSYDLEAAGRALTKEALQSRSRDQWRYMEVLPVRQTRFIQPIQVGWTPLMPARRLGQGLGLSHLFLKDDGRNPTGSFKDRASAVGVVRALEEGAEAIACSSTGNAASSLAGFAASAGIPAYIFVPRTAPVAKVTQLLVYGANVFLVDDTYDEAYRLCEEAVSEYGWYNRNCAVNPFLMEGKKTAGYEIWEQMGYEAPEVIVMAVGDGCSIAAVGKAFLELRVMGLISRLPRMIGVQAEGSSPMAKAFHKGTRPFDEVPDTVADSIAVGRPRNWRKATHVVRESGGTFISVTDDEILGAIPKTARMTGIFAEPAGATAAAGLSKFVAEGQVRKEDRVVVVVTGNGLKDIGSAQKVAGGAPLIRARMEDVRAALGGGPSPRPGRQE